MAERIVRQLIDDIDGTEISDDEGERILFSIRGADYQIDLCAENVAKLDKALKPYLDAAMKVRSGRSRPTPSTSASAAASKEHLAAIREWAKKNGHAVAERGRIRAEVVEAFEASH